MFKKQYLFFVILLLEFSNCGFSKDVPNVYNKNSIPTNNTVPVSPKPENNSSDLTHSGREHISETPLSKAVPITNNVVKNTFTNKSGNVTNGYQNLTDSHTRKVMNKNSTISENKEIYINNTKTSNLDKSLPVSTKNVSTSKISKSTSTIKPVIKKPLVTVHDDDADKTNSVFSEKNVPPSNIINIDPLLSEKKHNRSNYVVPIVAVIFSVPLVAGVLSILYKRGKDWWLHRNYRRMDYLIEGLYNS